MRERNMYPRHWSLLSPNRIAAVMGQSGEALSYEQLERKANQAAKPFRAKGCLPGDRVAFVLENCLDVYPFIWGAQRAGLHFVPVSSRLTVAEIAYIVEDSGARLLLASDFIGADTLTRLATRLEP